jgi:hypothetical protein
MITIGWAQSKGLPGMKHQPVISILLPNGNNRITQQ